MKHVPQRTCIACHLVKPKRQLVRLVCGPEGVVEVDTSGRKPGRGAYLCQSPGCWQKGLTRGKLEHALRAKISADNRARLLKFGTRIKAAGEATAQMEEAR
ncbi:MAG: YlxR family protein [Dehalococcoidia bacterium]|nr:YlxR family protein [Dehalococcoidia bacterium]